MSLKVSELAEKTGVSADTVRYYEKEGLLPEPGRTPSGYRQYGVDAVERLHFIRGAQTLGLKLRDIKELLSIRDLGSCPCGHTQQLLEQRVAEIDEEIRQLRPLKRELQSMGRLTARPILVLCHGLVRSNSSREEVSVLADGGCPCCGCPCGDCGGSGSKK